MNKDISDILRGWDYDPGSISARWIEGKDGRAKVQLRLDLGLFQMEVDGRPDGLMPHGYPSLAEYYLSLEKASREKPPFRLNDDACVALQQEAMQYYYRYLAYYALHHLEGVINDTAHNLDLIRMVTAYAEDEDLSWQFQQFYPYVLMMNARANAEKATESKRFEEAVVVLQKALDDIKSFWMEHSDYDNGLATQEIELLTGLLNQVESKKPKSRTDALREELQRAISVENYEKAASLRDTLSKLDADPSIPPPPGEIL